MHLEYYITMNDHIFIRFPMASTLQIERDIHKHLIIKEIFMSFGIVRWRLASLIFTSISLKADLKRIETVWK